MKNKENMYTMYIAYSVLYDVNTHFFAFSFKLN